VADISNCWLVWPIALESRPELAGPIESFVDLLLHDPQAAQDLPALPGAGARWGLIPIFEPDADLARLPSSDDPRTLGPASGDPLSDFSLSRRCC
jgi:hypothetical protein